MNEKTKNNLFTILLYGVLAFYLFLLLAILFHSHHETRSVNLIPFRGIVSYLTGQDLVNGAESTEILRLFAFDNVVGNIFIFIPLGIYCTLLNRNKSIWRNTFLVAAFSLAVEVIQYVSMWGVGDIDDVLLNTVGGLIGVLLYSALAALCEDNEKTRNVIAIAAPVIGALIIAWLVLFH